MPTGRTGLAVVILASACAAPLAWAQGWQVSPARSELRVTPGAAQTFAITLERENVPGAAPPPVRFTASPGDWDIDRHGAVQLLTPGTVPDSACAWALFSPTEVLLAPGGRGQVRATVTVPPGTAPGLYRFALLFQEHSPVPPQRDGTRRVVMRYRLSTLVYVTVPDVRAEFALDQVVIERGPADALRIRALLRNPGTAHLRPLQWVEVLDAQDQLLRRSDPMPTTVLLPGRELDVDFKPGGDLSIAGAARVRYVVDPGGDLPLQAASLQLAGAPDG